MLVTQREGTSGRNHASAYRVYQFDFHQIESEGILNKAGDSENTFHAAGSGLDSH